jgi:hypothetical protein
LLSKLRNPNRAARTEPFDVVDDKVEAFGGGVVNRV